MNRLIALLTPLILIGAMPNAAAQAARQKTFEERVNTPVVMTLPRMDEVRLIADQSYASAKDPRLLMDVYLPPGLKAGERRPVVMFVHGGTGSGTYPKDWGIYRSWGRLAAASGFIAVTFTHRLGYPKPMLAGGRPGCRRCHRVRARQRGTAAGGPRSDVPGRVLRRRAAADAGPRRKAALRALPDRLLRISRHRAIEPAPRQRAGGARARLFDDRTSRRGARKSDSHVHRARRA